jgi:hypothetical protein
MRTKPADIRYCGVRHEVIADAKPVLNEENVRHLRHWITERYSIRLKKESGKPKPWTADPILQKYRFCNVRREHDKETRWLIENIALNNDLSYDDKLMNCILFRLFNKSETMCIFGPLDFRKIDYAEIEKKLARHKHHHPGYVFFSNAFYTSGPKGAANRRFGRQGDIKIKIVRLVESYFHECIIPSIRQAQTQRDVYEALLRYDGLGQFLAYQIFVDLTYIPQFPFSENEFTVAGPGCKKGLHRIFKDFDGMTYEEALFWLRDNQQVITLDKDLFSDLPPGDRRLNIMSLENCMCEISKYLRALKNEGRPRIRYAGIE